MSCNNPVMCVGPSKYLILGYVVCIYIYVYVYVYIYKNSHWLILAGTSQITSWIPTYLPYCQKISVNVIYCWGKIFSLTILTGEIRQNNNYFCGFKRCFPNVLLHSFFLDIYFHKHLLNYSFLMLLSVSYIFFTSQPLSTKL